MVVLVLKGYRIFRHRHRTPFGEIDIIARRGQVLACVEVKYRTTEDFSTHVSVHQQRRIQRAGVHVGSKISPDLIIRFDVFLVKPWRFPVHIKSAWRSNSLET